MSVIREYVESQLIEPLKNYPTTIQDTLLSIIISRLEELYEYTKKFPEIISPNSTRIDIMQAILNQFQFSLREEADIYEQVSILDNILHVYNKRGSIDTIENMWKYYGGDLPKEIKVNIPSYHLFRHSISSFSGTDVYIEPEGDNRPGVYEIILHNNHYPIDKLKEFMLRELVAAGNRIYFSNSLYSILTGDDAAYEYNVYKNNKNIIEMSIVSYKRGLVFSGLGAFSAKNRYSYLSGKEDLLLELKYLSAIGTPDLGILLLSEYIPYNVERVLNTILSARYEMELHNMDEYSHIPRYLRYYLETSYTPEEYNPVIMRYLYNKDGDPVSSTFPGYFVLGETLLGNEVL